MEENSVAGGTNVIFLVEKACSELMLNTQTRGLTDYGVKDGNPVVLFLEPNVLRYTHCETCNCRRMRRNCVSPHALKDYSLTYHTDGHGVRTILTPPAPLAAVCTIG